MIDAGADTFFEGWNPKDPRFSPYGDLHVNSLVHYLLSLVAQR